MIGPARLAIWIGYGLLLSASAAAPQQPVPAQQPEAEAQAELAWRLDALSAGQLGPNRPDAAWRQSAALLQAAGRLDPGEPHFPRLRTLALLHVGDNEGAIEALTAYRALALSDRVAQVQLIDLYASRLQTLDAKLDYIKGLLDKSNIPVEVRAAVAVECTSLLAQKSSQQAAEMARRAMQLYPLPAATRYYYELVAKSGPLKERAAALLAVLKANPNQPAYLAELANLLASAGMTEASLPWYGAAITLITHSGPNRPSGFHNLLIDYDSQLLISGRTQPADTFVGQMLDEDPLDPDAWLFKLTITRSAGQEVSYGQTLDIAKNALVRRWNLLHDQILKGFAPTTQPAPAAASQPAAALPAETQPAASQPGNVEPLDPKPVIQKLASAPNPAAQQAFSSVVGDLAWFELYFDNQPQAARIWIDALRAVLPPDDLLVQRLEGWEQLVSEHPQQARELLAKTADHDPLAALGLIRADQAEKKPIDPEKVRKLLENNRTGLVSAMIWVALKDQNANPTTQPAANDVQAELNKFPQQWAGLLLSPATARRIYTIRAEPLRTSTPFGEPFLARITLDNNSDTDIAIGPDGVLRPDLWFDAQLLGLDQQLFRGVAFDQIANVIVLRAHSSESQIVRIDQGPLSQALERAPGATTRVGGDVITNPITPGDSVVPGPGGIAVNFARTFGAVGIALTDPAGKKKIDSALASNSPAERLRTLDLLAARVRLASAPNADEQVKQAAADLPQTIAKLRSDPSPSVAAWASYLAANLASGPQQESIVTEISASPDWTARLLSLVAGKLPPQKQRELSNQLATTDPDPLVKAAAQASEDLLDQAATQPTTQPATQP